MIDAVAASAERQIGEMPRRAIIAASLAGRGALIKVRDLDEACVVANRVAPEHLELAVAEPSRLLPKIRHAGAISWDITPRRRSATTARAPTMCCRRGRTARFSSPLGVYDFQKRSSVLDVSVAAARALGPVAATLAEGEASPRTRAARSIA
jgi:histidinol dehydrogenase